MPGFITYIVRATEYGGVDEWNFELRNCFSRNF